MLKRILPVISCLILFAFVLPPGVETREQQPQASFTQGRSVADETIAGLTSQGFGPLGNEPLDHIIAEGDSWFAYPGLDVLGAMSGGKLSGGARYRVYSAAKAGDMVESMAYDGEQLEGFLAEFWKVRDAGRQSLVKAILLSGGGNDIAGQEFHILLNHASSSLGATAPLDEPLADAFIDRLGRSLESLIGTARRFSETILQRNDIPILVHGYAPPVPDGRPFLIGWPLPGPWLQPGFSSKGYLRDDPQDLERNARVMTRLITKFNARVARIEKDLAGVADVRYVNVTTALSNNVTNDAYKRDWSNELHPRDTGFTRVAEAFHQRILKK